MVEDGVRRGRLELTWTNKEMRLLTDEFGSYEWVRKHDYRVEEVRLLHDVRTYGVVSDSRATDDLLIHGDALNGLHSLANLPEFALEYAGKIRLAYIDPPFNTQQAFAHYDDALEHSVWLTMMRDRLEQVKRLLAPHGSVWVHCDDAELVGYLRVLLDEVFGRDNFIATIVWEKADSPRNSARHFSVDQDYILCFAIDADQWRPNRLARDESVNRNYSNPDNDPRGPWLSGDLRANKPYSLGRYTISGPTGRLFDPPPGKFWRVSEERFWHLDEDSRIWWGPNGDALPTQKRFLSEVGNLVPRTLWEGDVVGTNRTSSNEQRHLFPDQERFATPKPERLLRRVIEIGSDQGDIVLDCFAGSATTAAVAHKLERRWVVIERAYLTIESFAIPRLDRVIAGTDGIGTPVVDQAHCRGFRVLAVAPSMYGATEGRTVLSPWATNGKLAEAVAAQFGYHYQPDPPFAGMKGLTRLAVIDGLVNAGVIELLVPLLGIGETLHLCGTAVDDSAIVTLLARRAGSQIDRIPEAMLARYQRKYGRTSRWERVSG